MADMLQAMNNKRKERQATLRKLQNAAKAEDAVLRSQKQLANTLKSAQIDQEFLQDSDKE